MVTIPLQAEVKNYCIWLSNFKFMTLILIEFVECQLYYEHD